MIVIYDLIGTYLPDKYFRYKKVDDEYHIYFPDDSSMKGLFFIVLKRDVQVETDGLKIQINNKTTTFVLDMEKKIFNRYEWIKIKTYVERYVRIKERKVR